jgi:hypothetical protein
MAAGLPLSSPYWFEGPVAVAFFGLAVLDLTVIAALFLWQGRYRLLEVGMRQRLAILCWSWSVVSWVLVCAGMGR